MRLQRIFWRVRLIAHQACGSLLCLAILAAGLAPLLPAGARAATTGIAYIGPNNGLWNTASNWSPAVVPANTGTTQFTVTIAGNPVVFNLAGASTVNDLLLSNSLQLNANCNLTVANQLSLSNASLTANGGNFTANGPATSATNLNLNASSGAQVALQALTQITENSWGYGPLQANGANSLLDLSHVTTMAVNGGLSVTTSSGGDVNLHNLLAITSSSGQTASLNASSGTINVSNLGGGTGNSGVSSVTLSNSGTVLWGSPTSLNTLSVTITGTGNILNLGQVASATDLNLNASGGAHVTLPALTQITENSWGYGPLQANGANSLLDLSHVTTMAVNGGLSVTTSSGGDVNLHNLLAITNSSGQTASLNASSGTINVSSLGGGTGNSGLGSATLSNSGTVLWGSPTSLNTFSLTITGTGNTIDVSHVASATDLNLNASGGAQVALPALTQITENSWGYGPLQANGANSLLDLSHVTTMAVNGGLSVTTSSGGDVNLHNLLSITSSSGQTASLNASSGTINVSNLGGGTSNSGLGSVTLSNSGTVLWGSPTSLKTFSLTITGTGNTLNLSQVASATDLNLNASGGAQVALPALTQITENSWGYGPLQANGANSLLDLSHVTTMAVNGG